MPIVEVAELPSIAFINHRRRWRGLLEVLELPREIAPLHRSVADLLSLLGVFKE